MSPKLPGPWQAFVDGSQSEDSFLDQVLALAKVCGWRRAHFRPAQTKHGWRTAVSGDGKGFPDLLLIRRLRLVVIELKSEAGNTTREQEEWLSAFDGVPGVEVYIFRPSDWHEIERSLA